MLLLWILFFIKSYFYNDADDVDSQLPAETPSNILADKPKFDYNEMDDDKYNRMKATFFRLESKLLLIKSFIVAIPPSIFALIGTFIWVWSTSKNAFQVANIVGAIIFLTLAIFKFSNDYASGSLKQHYLVLLCGLVQLHCPMSSGT